MAFYARHLIGEKIATGKRMPFYWIRDASSVVEDVADQLQQHSVRHTQRDARVSRSLNYPHNDLAPRWMGPHEAITNLGCLIGLQRFNSEEVDKCTSVVFAPIAPIAGGERVSFIETGPIVLWMTMTSFRRRLPFLQPWTITPRSSRELIN